MPRYDCVAFDIHGKEKHEQLDAASENEAIAQLRKRNLTVVELRLISGDKKEATEESAAAFSKSTVGKVPIAVVLNFYEQLAFLIKAGIPIYMAIKMLGDTFKNRNLAQILKEVMFGLSEGSPLSSALQRYPESFPPFHTSLIAVGEKSGNLDESLAHLVDLVRERQETREGLVKAAAYPIFLLVLSVSLVVGLLVFIFPKFQEIFSSFHVKLPTLTAFFIGASEYLRGHSATLLTATSAMLFGLWYFFTSEQTSAQRDKLFLSLPLFEDVFVSMFVATFTKTLSNLLRAGIPLLEALVICQQTIRGVLKFKFFEKVIETVREGEPMSKGMEGSQFIPEMARQLVIVAESTGQIDLMMENIFKFYKKRYREMLGVTTAVVQPLLMFFAAGLIAMVAISLFVPLFKLSSAMRGQE
jgi:type IV pilus assembly protein PilC